MTEKVKCSLSDCPVEGHPDVMTKHYLHYYCADHWALHQELTREKMKADAQIDMEEENAKNNQTF